MWLTQIWSSGVLDMKLLDLPTGSHATSDTARPEKLSSGGGQFVISNTSLGPAQVQEDQTTGTSPAIPTQPTNHPSPPADRSEKSERLTSSEFLPIISSIEPELETVSDPTVVRNMKQATIIEPTFLFSTETSTFHSVIKSRFFKVSKVENSEGNLEKNMKKTELVEGTTESITEDMTEVIIIRKCSFLVLYGCSVLV